MAEQIQCGKIRAELQSHLQKAILVFLTVFLLWSPHLLSDDDPQFLCNHSMKPVSTLASATVYYLYLFLLFPHSLMPRDTGRRAVVSFTGAVED